MKTIALSRGLFALVDASDYDNVRQWNWYAARRACTDYAARHTSPTAVLYMHRMITECPDHLQVDHINHNGLDNRRLNLRCVTVRANVSHRSKPSTSKYTGVCWEKSVGKWLSAIRIDGKKRFLGRFDNELEAHEAYQSALSVHIPQALTKPILRRSK